MHQLEDDGLNSQLENRNASLHAFSLSLSSVLFPLTGFPWASLNTPKLLRSLKQAFCKSVCLKSHEKCFMNVERAV